MNSPKLEAVIQDAKSAGNGAVQVVLLVTVDLLTKQGQEEFALLLKAAGMPAIEDTDQLVGKKVRIAP